MHHLRDFRSLAIFEFFNTIGAKRSFATTKHHVLTAPLLGHFLTFAFQGRLLLARSLSRWFTRSNHAGWSLRQHDRACRGRLSTRASVQSCRRSAEKSQNDATDAIMRARSRIVADTDLA